MGGNQWHQIDVAYLSIYLVTVYMPRFEDHAALDGGKDGLKIIKQILTLAPRILSNNG